ncbi:hypothetical protein RR46_06487 [Papilio xuthus]|uniref:Uncharacterized protein n=1 Tax=Papilio xuthus TaxID=66420 RepID=A0A194QIQ2_PAPXU|nr:hypothetical protein RR46_06487 [Papilio xuthus]
MCRCRRQVRGESLIKGATCRLRLRLGPRLAALHLSTWVARSALSVSAAIASHCIARLNPRDAFPFSPTAMQLCVVSALFFMDERCSGEL